MAQEEISSSQFSEDVQEFLRLLWNHKVKYLIVGGEAVIYYGHVRLTGDIDIFYECSKENADRLFTLLEEFWDGKIPGITNLEELLEQRAIIQFGRPPNRIDLINEIEGVGFKDAWAGRKTVKLMFKKNSIPVHYINLEDLIKNKEMVQRPKDLEDLKYLYAVHKKVAKK